MIQFRQHPQGYEIFIDKAFVGDLYPEISGEWVYLPKPQVQGYIPSWVLHAIARKLDELNAEWNASIERYFGEIKRDFS